jgi:hypothetical protein
MDEIDYSSVPFLNIDSEDFIGYWDSKPYTIKAGETKFYPQFLAEHFAKHLSDKLMQERGMGLRDLAKRSQIVAQILSTAVLPASEPESEEAPEVQVVAPKPLTKSKRVAKSKVEKVVEVKPFSEL